MQVAKIFKNGKSQAVRLPKEFRFQGEEIYIKKQGGVVLLMPKNQPWKLFKDSLHQFSSDFMETRHQLPIQKRKNLFK